MAKRIKDEEIKVVVMNPERIPFMEETLTRILFEEYIREAPMEELEAIGIFER